jgi:hypothetical protein
MRKLAIRNQEPCWREEIARFLFHTGKQMG